MKLKATTIAIAVLSAVVVPSCILVDPEPVSSSATQSTTTTTSSDPWTGSTTRKTTTTTQY